MMNRRHLLAAGGALTALGLAPTRGLALANAPTDARLVVIVQRGAHDGLHAVPPYAERDYGRLRPRLAVPAPGAENGALDLDGYFGLHPQLGVYKRLYDAGELLIAPAAASRYRERSHFDGQNLLETGGAAPFQANDGWLNRALAGFGDGTERLGMAFGHTVPLILLGPAGVRTWAPSSLPEVDQDFLVRLMRAYEGDALFTDALAEGMDPLDLGLDGAPPRVRQQYGGGELTLAAQAAAAALVADDGPRIAAVESEGWDTHFNQVGRMNGLLAGYNAAMDALVSGLAPVWDKTLVVTISEFGRTARENGSAGTDHGTAGVSAVFGGPGAGGRILDAWPGLSSRALYEDRDLAPATSLEGLLKGVLIAHLGLSPAHVEDVVFPDSRALPPLDGLTWASSG